MSFFSWLLGSSDMADSAQMGRSRRRSAPSRPAPRFRPRLEALEDRWVPSTLTVTNNLDSGAGSLRADIAAAHSGDTIVFAPSLDGQTITLTSGELLIRKNLTIAGPGASQLTISGNNASRVFEVAKGETDTLSGLTISNGAAPSVRQAGEGGGILVDSGATLTVSGSTLSGNSAPVGGGIYNGGTLTVSNSTLSGNSAGLSGQGGGIHNEFGTLTISGSILSDNYAGSDGGAIQNYGTLTISGSTLSGNWANYGGGIWNDGTATVSGGSTLSSNNANSVGGGAGGGIDNLGGATLTVTDSTLSSNSANQGGGIRNDGTLTVSGSTLSGNTANYEGGGILNYGTATVKNSSSITGNTAPVGFGADVDNQGLLHLDSTSTIGILDGNPAKPI